MREFNDEKVFGLMKKYYDSHSYYRAGDLVWFAKVIYRPDYPLCRSCGGDGNMYKRVGEEFEAVPCDLCHGEGVDLLSHAKTTLVAYGQAVVRTVELFTNWDNEIRVRYTAHYSLKGLRYTCEHFDFSHRMSEEGGIIKAGEEIFLTEKEARKAAEDIFNEHITLCSKSGKPSVYKEVSGTLITPCYITRD